MRAFFVTNNDKWIELSEEQWELLRDNDKLYPSVQYSVYESVTLSLLKPRRPAEFIIGIKLFNESGEFDAPILYNDKENVFFSFFVCNDRALSGACNIKTEAREIAQNAVDALCEKIYGRAQGAIYSNQNGMNLILRWPSDVEPKRHIAWLTEHEYARQETFAGYPYRAV